MIKVYLIMFMCSTTPGNECRKIPTPIEEFKDVYECTIAGYQYSLDVVNSLSREFINKYGAHTRFVCELKQTI